MAEVMDKIVHFITGTEFDDIPNESIEYAKILCLSQLAAMAGGVQLPISRIVAEHVKSQGGVAEAGVAGHGFKAPAAQAALCNATFIHATELEDDNVGGGSTIGTVIPAMFTLAQARQSSGKDLLTSIIVGYDVQVKTSIATRATRKGLMSICTGAWGPAASAAKLMKLDTAQSKMTMGIVASLLGGLLGQVPSMTHFLESGTGAQNGLLAAMLAERGCTSNPDILEAHGGYWDAMGFDRDGLDLLGQMLGQDLRIMQVGIKKYGCANITHRLIDGLSELIGTESLVREDIGKVAVEVAPWFTHEIKYPDPVNADQARFSIQHVLAATLIGDPASLHTFTDQTARNPLYAEARKRIEVQVDPDRGHIMYQGGPDIITVTMVDGSTHRKVCEAARGHPPSYLTADDVIHKFRSASDFSGYLAPGSLERISELVLNLDQLDDVSEIMDLLTYGRMTN